MQNLRLGKMEKLLQVRQGLLSCLQMVAGIDSFTISVVFSCVLFLFIWCTFQTSAHNFLVSSKRLRIPVICSCTKGGALFVHKTNAH